ncbi:unnamed protein product [Meloidogyne enterolobii]|uniref:Uncharacterized protein n=1 Tax=Meloidogyne enterolobii TaxID=390850 RepID=A0ACB0YQ09_MELEN
MFYDQIVEVSYRIGSKIPLTPSKIAAPTHKIVFCIVFFYPRKIYRVIWVD